MNQMVRKSFHQLVLRRCRVNSSVVSRTFCDKIQKTEAEKINEEHENKLSGFAKAFEKFSEPYIEKKEEEPDLPFATLFRRSKFVELGDPAGKIVIGKIFHIVDDDLYIDFGWKFHCVCTRPSKNGTAYVRGARVKLRIKELELASRFLGSAKDLTLLEADCQLLGLLSSPSVPKNKTTTPIQ